MQGNPDPAVAKYRGSTYLKVSPRLSSATEQVAETAGLFCLDVGHEGVADAARVGVEATDTQRLHELANVGLADSDTEAIGQLTRFSLHGAQVRQSASDFFGSGHCD